MLINNFEDSRAKLKSSLIYSPFDAATILNFATPPALTFPRKQSFAKSNFISLLSEFFLVIALLSVSAFASAEVQPLIYGQTYHLQNGYKNWSGGYLDTKIAGCKDNLLCVSTSTFKNRDQDSGSWLIKSADWKADGSAVMNGDRIFLVNEYPYKDGAYFPSGRYGGVLDVRDSKCQDNILCVSTSESKNRDNWSGAWTVEASSSDIYLDQSIHLKNVYDGSYLDVRGNNCQGNLLCVSTSTWADRDQGSGSWRFQLAHEIETLAPIHKAQVLTYLKLSKIKLGLLINFNTIDLKEGIQRLIM